MTGACSCPRGWVGWLLDRGVPSGGPPAGWRDGDGPSCPQHTVTADNSLSASHMELTVKLLRTRLQSRLALHKQFASLGGCLTPCPVPGDGVGGGAVARSSCRGELTDVTFNGATGLQCRPRHSQSFPLSWVVAGLRGLPSFGWERKACAPSRCPAPFWDWPSLRWESIRAVVGGEPQARRALPRLRAPVGWQPRPPLLLSGHLMKVLEA